ncbi:Universal stress protein [Marinobacterium lacunae]|uniref:Universal stress protein n=1 Tax=Marinobacterium lacunae TaxID=1232683 RepID=A0A081FX13_9GAMM|nr:universal stress protein [Marinobacterium lacunae]KEA63068.1 Universal stress protein [Marinobacterium lacunae]
MYQHLLVPIDGSALSDAMVEQAITFARSLNARVTFFHARPDFGASSDGALLEAMAPDAFSVAARGNSNGITSRAEAASFAAGVSASSLIKTSDHPERTILAAAKELGCDLIFMASHGHRGLKGVLHGSVTRKVLQDTTLPVLVAQVESNLRADDETRAIAVIKREHRSLAAVIRGLQHLIAEAHRVEAHPDFALLDAMLLYIERFPETLHHPKEDRYLFAALRERTEVCDAVLEELEHQHKLGASYLSDIHAALNLCKSGINGSIARLSVEVEKFAQMQWQHMKSEEEQVLPAARQYLLPSDWAAMAQAFEANKDPRFDADTDAAFKQLFSRLMNLAESAAQG